LSNELTILQHNGVVFNVEERFRLEMALQSLQNESKETDFEELLFWGRINGAEGNYYIAVGISYKGSYEFPKKTFFWCSEKNDFVFEKMPLINEHWRAEVNKRSAKPFKGTPSVVLKKGKKPDVIKEEKSKSDEPRDELDSTEEEDPDAMLEIPDLTELARLTWHVSAIDFDCSVVPQGTLKLTVAHEVERDEKFNGLNLEDVFNLENYSHFRVVQAKEKRELLDADEAIFSSKFLDDLAADNPKECWSILKVGSDTALIRNNIWRGFTAYAKASTTRNGCCYVGNGMRNTSLAFL